MIFDGTNRATLRPGMAFTFARPKSKIWRVVYVNSEPGGHGIMSPAVWADLPDDARAVVDVLHECKTEAEARDLYQSRYVTPAPGPWQVAEREPPPQPQHTDLTVIDEVFETIDRRAITGLHRAVAAADARACDAELRALMAEGRAQAAWRGQVPVMMWAFALGMVLGVLASVIC